MAEQNPNMSPESQNINFCGKRLPVILAVAGMIAVAGLVWWWMSGKSADERAAAPTATPNAQSQETADINNDLSEINAGDLNAEFNQIDQDLNGL